MSEETVNIRVYRTTSAEGHLMFEEMNQDAIGKFECNSIRSLARNARTTVGYMHSHGYDNVSIDFTPFHNIECPSGLPPRLCSPLTAAEQAEFWKYFSQG